MKTSIYIIAASTLCIYASGCTNNETPKTTTTETVVEKSHTGDDLDGIGKYHNIELTATLDKALAEKGKGVYELKCSACHRLTDEKLVGPGWKGVLSRRTPAWILNFATNTDEMLDKYKAAQGMLEICLVRMPNQSVSEPDAYAVLEFMRQNDGVK